MSVSTLDRFTLEHAVALYGIDAWGNGYFGVNEAGHLTVMPTREPERAIDVLQVVEEARRRGLRTPLLLRFPQLLEAQVQELTTAFAKAREEFRYPATYRPLFPLKVNHRRSVVEALLRAGEEAGLGLEVGSRPELLAALALPTPPGSLIVCNGYKDNAYLDAAALARRLGKRVIVVLEKLFELDRYLARARNGAELPEVGLRLRLHARGSGLWEKSGGFAAKFGLTTSELLTAVERLSSAGLADRIVMLHFHIGSQITEIRRVKNAVREAARIYAKLCRSGRPIQFLDVGGGLGIDYDGSRTSSDASINYTVQEYANDVVFGALEVCQEEGVPPPHLLSESGRRLVAYHALLVVDVLDVISPAPAEVEVAPEDNAPAVIRDLAEIAATISVKNYREYYHDALEYRDHLYSLFRLGLLSLEDRARGELLFWKIAERAVAFAKTAKLVADEFLELEQRLHEKYICNFSVFQSLPDHWALDQLFPIVPIHRLNERPVHRATLVDITCDSDGQVDKFVDLKAIKPALEVHPCKRGERYYLGVALAGAYQDPMGDLHNLFGTVHEVQAVLDPEGRTVLTGTQRGDRACDTLLRFGYTRRGLLAGVRALIARAEAEGRLDAAEGATLLERYRRALGRYPYLA